MSDELELEGELELVVSSGTKPRLSFSRMLTYLTCPQKYYYKYVEKIGEREVTPSLLLGTLTHSLLERLLLSPTSVPEIAAEVVTQFLSESCALPINLAESLYDVSMPYSELIARTHAAYTGPDPIRNNDGSVPTDVIAYPPNAWKAELRNHGTLLRYKSEIDIAAGDANALFRTCSITDIFSQACAFARCFTIPNWIQQTEGVEVPIEEVPLSPSNHDADWTGIVDWVVRTVDNRICLIDHKTSKSLPLELDVSYHPQLAVYAYMWAHYHNGVLPDLLAIHHVRSGSYQIVPVSAEIVKETVQYFAQLYESSLVGLPYRHMPTEYNSPCVKRHYKSNVPLQVCNYLDKCWPSYYQHLLADLNQPP